MKKFILTIAIVMVSTMCFTNCGSSTCNSGCDSTLVASDSDSVVADTLVVDTVAVDTTSVD